MLSSFSLTHFFFLLYMTAYFFFMVFIQLTMELKIANVKAQFNGNKIIFHSFMHNFTFLLFFVFVVCSLFVRLRLLELFCMLFFLCWLEGNVLLFNCIVFFWPLGEMKSAFFSIHGIVNNLVTLLYIKNTLIISCWFF